MPKFNVILEYTMECAHIFEADTAEAAKDMALEDYHSSEPTKEWEFDSNGQTEAFAEEWPDALPPRGPSEGDGSAKSLMDYYQSIAPDAPPRGPSQEKE